LSRNSFQHSTEVLPSSRPLAEQHRVQQLLRQQVSAGVDRPMRCSAAGPPCCTKMPMVSVINWWPRPSPVYHTNRPPTLTAPEPISRSRYMVGAHLNLSGSCDLTTPLSGMVCHPWASTCYRQPTTQHKDMKGDTKCQNGWFGVAKVTRSHWEYYQSIEHIW